MSTNRKASMAKRQRELDQKDRVREREQRREERRVRLAERIATGQVGAPMAEPPEPLEPDEPADADAAAEADDGPAPLQFDKP